MTETENTALTLLGRVIMAVGILIMALTGACTLLLGGGMAISVLGQPNSYIGATAILGLALAIGGAGFAPGVGLFFLGRWMARRAGRAPTP